MNDCVVISVKHVERTVEKAVNRPGEASGVMAWTQWSVRARSGSQADCWLHRSDCSESSALWTRNRSWGERMSTLPD